MKRREVSDEVWAVLGPMMPTASGRSRPWTDHRLAQLWGGSITVSGFSAGAYFPTHPQFVRRALGAAVKAVASGLGDAQVDVMPLSDAAVAHERMESRAIDGRIVLAASSLR